MPMLNRFMAVGTMIAAATLAATAGIAAADNFYEGKRITIAVGFTPGGGNDLYARLLAQHIGRHIPGNPVAIVQNMPGAASSKPVLYLDAGAPKDGTEIASFGPDIIPLSLLDPETMKIDFSKLSWIGSISRDLRMCYAWHESAVKSWNDLLEQKPFNVGASGPGSNAYTGASILKRMFHTNTNIIAGYPGSAEQRIAIERRELDGGCGAWNSLPAEWIEDHKIRTIVRLSPAPIGDGPQAPYVGDLVRTDQERQILVLLLSAADLARPYVASLAVPADRVAILRAAFDATMTDPAFLADTKKADLPVSPVSGADAAKMIATIAASKPEVVAAAREIVK
jgi:tripartite-type tricarboxylate transporter receptor subunit TctC